MWGGASRRRQRALTGYVVPMRKPVAVVPSLLAAACFVVVAILAGGTLARVLAAAAALCFVVVATQGYFGRR